MKALAIWVELAVKCAQATRFYTAKFPGRSGGLQKSILQQGAADFDCKHDPADPREKARYRSDYYASRDGYLAMHIKQNLAALQLCFDGGIPQPLLWVDFGCGPMTSGLALAEQLSAQNPRYKSATAYFGIDASRNMAAKAHCINEQYKLFAPARFKVVQSRHFDAGGITRIGAPALASAKTAVLCCSFVLAPGTLQAHDGGARALAEAWKAFVSAQPHCAETRVIYLNPKGDFHRNWRAFQRAMLAPHSAANFHYTGGNLTTLPVPGLRPITLAMLHGSRQ